MSYILFDTETTKIVRVIRNGYWQDAKFATLAAAKAGATRLHKAGKLAVGSYSILEAKEFAKIEKTETVINLTGSNSKIIFHPLPSDDPKQRQPDISMAVRNLNWTPKVELLNGLARTIKYFDELKLSDSHVPSCRSS